MPSRAARVVRAPRQSRSAEGLERMLAAAEAVLAEKDFDAATLAEIAARAGYTIGAFYARFADKRALLTCLEERTYAALAELLATYIAPDAWATEPLPDLVRAMMAGAVAAYRRHRGALRALVVAARTDPALRARLNRANRATLDRFTAAVVARRADLAHPDPAAGAEFAVLAAGSAMREVILFGDVWPLRGAMTDERLAEELSEMVLRYLGAREATRRGERSRV